LPFHDKSRTVLFIAAENPNSIAVLEPVAKESEKLGWKPIFLSMEKLYPYGADIVYQNKGLKFSSIPVGKPIIERNRLRYLKVYYQVRLWARRYLRRLKPALVVTLKNTGVPGLFVLAAKERKIPTLHVQEAFIVKPKKPSMKMLLSPKFLGFLFRHIVKITAALLPPPFDYIKLFAYRLGMLRCNIVAVAGDIWADTFVDYGIPPRRISITGSPGYDHLFKNMLHSSVSCTLPPEFKELTGKKIILFAQQPLRGAGASSVKDEDMIYRNLIETVSKIDNVELLIKVHPRDSVEHVKSRIKAMGLDDGKYHIYKGGSIDEILPFCSLLITVNSTTFMNALIYNVPVVIIDYIDMFYKMKIIDSGSLMRVKRPEETLTIIKEAVFDHEIRSTLIDKGSAVLKGLSYGTDGKSAQRIAKIVDRLGNKNVSRS